MGKALRSGLAALGVCGTCWLAASCGYTTLYLGDDWGDGGASGSSVSSGGNGDTCQGTCETTPMSPWLGGDFSLIWVGPEGQAPECPEDTPQWFYGVTHIVAPEAKCEPCTCKPPKGSCELPTTLSAYATPVCPAPMNAPFQSFDVKAPIPWDGQCNKDSPIAGVPNCSGPECIQGLTVEPPVVHDPPACEPEVPSPAATVEKPHFAQSARVCRANQVGCDNSKNTYCREGAPMFMECFFKEGVYPNCPDGWTDRYVFYRDQEAFTDTRGCKTCTCEAPVGSKCSTSVSVYTDDCCGCNNPGAPALLTLPVDSTGSKCGNVLSGSALGSKAATTPVYQPGSCAPSGGEPTGDATGDETTTDNAYTACCWKNVFPR